MLSWCALLELRIAADYIQSLSLTAGASYSTGNQYVVHIRYLSGKLYNSIL